MPLGAWESFARHDEFLVGDFDGNGRDDLVVYNMVDFTMPYFALLLSNNPATEVGFTVAVRYDRELPGWGAMKPGDKFYVGDFDGDGKSDLYVANTNLTDWPMGYLGMLRSTGTGFEMVRRYDDVLPGWDRIKPGDQFLVANIDGLGGKDLYVANTSDWCAGYLISLLSNGTSLNKGSRYDQTLPGWGNLLGGDQFFVGRFDSSDREGLYAFNGTNYPVPYLGVFRSVGGGALDVPVLHEGSVEGWAQLKPNDRFLPANVDGLPGTDLFVSNFQDWGSHKYVGHMVVSEDGFRGDWQDGTLGKWNLAAGDVFHVGNFDGTPSGGTALDDLVVHNDATSKEERFGVLISDGNTLTTSALYSKWLHHYRYHSSGYY